jgi:quercetin dioxygenase-like cupin family protein
MIAHAWNTVERSSSTTILVVEGRLAVNDRVLGPGDYCHFPAGEKMWHAPAGGGSCLFISMFHGPSDVEAVDE